MSFRTWIVAAAALGFLLTGSRLRAHQPGLSTLFLELGSNRLSAQLILAWEELDGTNALDLNRDRVLSPEELAAARPRLLRLGEGALSLEAGGRMLALKASPEIQMDETNGLRFQLTYELPSAPMLLVTSEIISELRADHSQIVMVRDAAGVKLGEAVLDRKKPTVEIPLRANATSVRTFSASRDFVRLGLKHILEGWDHLGYPIAEVASDGTFVVTKHAGTGGLVSVDTVGEQLVYEMGDPTRYLTPDCVADFTSIRLESEGRDRVRVTGIKGGPATDTYKVSISYLEGYKAVGQLTVSGPDAEAKARICAEAIWGRLKRAGVTFEQTLTELVGVDACHGPLTRGHATPGEIVLRVGVKDRSKARVDRFGKELAPLVTTGPPGVTGFAGGRPKATEVLGYWPALIPKHLVTPHVVVEEVP